MVRRLVALATAVPRRVPRGGRRPRGGARLLPRRPRAPRRGGERDDRAPRPRLVQLQRLPGEQPAPLPGGRRRRGAPRVLRLGALRRPQRQPRGAARLRALPPPAAVGGPRARPPGGPRPAGLRRLPAAALRLRQPAAQRAPRLPVPDEPARGRGPLPLGGSSWPSAAAGGGCGTRSARPSPGRACRSSTARSGTPACSCGSAASPCRSRWPSPRGRSATRRVRDDNDGKQVSGRLAWTPSPALVAGVSGAVGRVPRARGAGRPPGVRAGHLPAEGGGPRPPVVLRVLDRARGSRVEPLEPARARGHEDRGAARRAGRLRGGALQDPARALRRGPRRAAGVLRDPERGRPANVGRAGDAGRGRRRLLAVAVRPRSRPRGSTTGGTGARSGRTTSWPGRWSCGSERRARRDARPPRLGLRAPRR